jgi:hypothetical protein
LYEFDGFTLLWDRYVSTGDITKIARVGFVGNNGTPVVDRWLGGDPETENNAPKIERVPAGRKGND